MPTSRSAAPIGSPHPARESDGHRGPLQLPRRWHVAVRVAVHQPAPDSTQATWLDSAPDLSCTNSTQAYCVDVEHQPTDLAVGVFRSADRTSLEAVLKAPGDDPARTDPDDRVVEPLHDGLTSSVERARLPAHLDGTGLPGREHVVDHQRRHARPLDVAELLALGEVVPADVDGVGVGVVAEGNRDDMRHAVVADRGEPSEPLACEVLDFGIAEHAHGVLLLAGHSPAIPPRTTSKMGSHQMDGTADLSSDNDTERGPLDGWEPTHNRKGAGSSRGCCRAVSRRAAGQQRWGGPGYDPVPLSAFCRHHGIARDRHWRGQLGVPRAL